MPVDDELNIETNPDLSSRNEISYPFGGIFEPANCDDVNFARFVVPLRLLSQHFLSNPAKLALLIEAADVQPTDHVLEVGADIGTVAEHVPACQSLTVIEYDANLTPHLRGEFPTRRSSRATP